MFHRLHPGYTMEAYSDEIAPYFQKKEPYIALLVPKHLLNATNRLAAAWGYIAWFSEACTESYKGFFVVSYKPRQDI